MFTQELLLSFNRSHSSDDLERDLCCLGHHGHLLRDRHDWHCLLRSGSSEGWESRHVHGLALRLRLGWSSHCFSLILGSILLLSVWSVLLVWSSLVWILLRLVVAVLLIASSAAASALATGTVWHGLLLVLHWPTTLVWLLLLLTIATLVVISVTPRLVLGVLLLILIPADATCGSWIAATLSEATLLVAVVVAATTVVVTVAVAVIVVAALTPAVP